MADKAEPPPFDSDEEKEETNEEGEDLFTSTTEEAPSEQMKDLEIEKDAQGDNTPVTKTEDPPVQEKTEEVDLDEEDLFSDDITKQSEPAKQETYEPPPSKPAPVVLEEPKEETYQPPPKVKVEPEKNDLFEEDEKEEHEIAISVSEPHKVGDGMSAYMSYRVKTNTTMSFFKRSEMIVDRRFSDFLGLHEKLLAKHRHIGRFVPPAPEKSIVGMTRVKMSKSDEEATAFDFVERRRAALERYLAKTANHPTLLQDPDFRDFLELEVLPPATSTRALSSAGVMRFVKNVEGAISKITIKMTEDDSWFEEKQQQIESLDMQLSKLHVSLEDLVRHRKEHAMNCASFAKHSATLGNAEEHTSLSRALAQLSEAFERVESLNQDVAHSDFYNVSEILGDYIRVIEEIKEVFQVRVKSWQNWQNAEQTLAKKRETEVKLQGAGKTDKIPQIQADIKEWEDRSKTSKKEFDDLSSEIKKEMKQFEFDRIKDFKRIILVLLKSLMKSQEQNIKYWEGFLPEARAIA